jgi:cytochrome P450
MSRNTTELESPLPSLATRYLTDPVLRRDPWSALRDLRAHAPIIQSDAGVWLITGYDAASEALRNDQLLSRREAGIKHLVVDDPLAEEILTSKMLYNDRPEHTRLRRLVSHAFTRGGITAWQSRIREAATAQLERIGAARHMDMVRDYAYPVVETIITEMVGVGNGDLAQFLAWSEAIVEPPPGGDAGQLRERANAAMREITEYMRQRIAARRASPAQDLLTILIAAEEPDDGRLSEAELVAVTIELIHAGFETTSIFVCNAMHTLLQHPGQLAELRADRSLLPAAIDELLRYASPAPFAMPRVARGEVAIGDQTISRGETVVVALAAANRDPAQFTEPERFDIHRSDNAQLAFGFGAHYCLGNALARLESTEMLAALLDGLPTLTTAGEARWSDHHFFRTLESLPVAW